MNNDEEKVRLFRIARELQKNYPKRYFWYKYGSNGKTEAMALIDSELSDTFWRQKVFLTDFTLKEQNERN